jgi:hypothetical protein
MSKHIVACRYSAAQAQQDLKGLRLCYSDVARLNLQLLPRDDVSFYTVDGDFIAMFLTDIFTDAEQEERAIAYSHVDGGLRNRPEIFGNLARQQLIRKDGEFTDRVGVAPEVLETAGKSATFGYYRYKNSAPGVPDCRLTAPTLERPHIYSRILAIEMKVTEIYRAVLPDRYEEQMAYIDSILPAWKTEGSAFTTSYALRNQPTAVHVDEFDIPTATGVITTVGNFTGGEFCMPEFGLAFDVQPSDILFADVHRWHGNLPRRSGDRTSQVFFVRKGMHECP